jgi:hypothetical protein
VLFDFCCAPMPRPLARASLHWLQDHCGGAASACSFGLVTKVAKTCQDYARRAGFNARQGSYVLPVRPTW